MFMSHGSLCRRLSTVDGAMSVMEVPAMSSMAEEADTRMLFHAKHAASTSSPSAIVIRSCDTDVLVLCIYFHDQIDARLLMERRKGRRISGNSQTF